jgi:phage shock protein A
MALINRMARLFTADLHAVLDRIEEPDVLLRQAVREMEEAVAQAERRTTALARERDTLAARRTQIDATLPELTSQLDLCFESGNEVLARKLIRRRLEAERRSRRLAERIDALGHALSETRESLAADRERLEQVRQKAELLAEQADDEVTAGTRDPLRDAWSDDATVGDDEVEVEFLRERRRRAQS